MMRSDIEKITVLKTRVDLHLSCSTKHCSEKEAVIDLVLKALICGASPNIINQISDYRVSENGFMDVEVARERFEEILQDLKADIAFALSIVEPKTHKFH